MSIDKLALQVLEMAKIVADHDKRLERIEYELTEVRFRCKALECRQDPKHKAWFKRFREERIQSSLPCEIRGVSQEG